MDKKNIDFKVVLSTFLGSWISILLIAILFGTVSVYISYITPPIWFNSKIWESLFSNLGIALYVSGFFTVFDKFYSSADLSNVIAEKTKASLINLMDSQNSCIAYNHGIKHLWRKRDDIKNFGDLIENAKQIDIYTTNLNYLVFFIEKLRANKKKVRILAMNPMHPFIRIRHQDVKGGGVSEKVFFNEVNNSLHELLTSGLDIEIRIFNSSPTIMMYRFDNVLIIGYILKHGRSRDQIHISFDYNNLIVNREFKTHFESEWSIAEPISEYSYCNKSIGDITYDDYCEHLKNLWI